MARAGVVPAMGCLGGEGFGDLIDRDRDLRVEPLEEDAERGGHDSATDEDYV